MRFTRIALLITVFLLASAHSQRAPITHEASTVPGMIRIKTMQNQIEKQQIEINALRLRLEKLQQQFQDLAETVADQSTEADDEDSADDADVAAFVVSSRSKRSSGNPRRAARSMTVVSRKQLVSAR